MEYLFEGIPNIIYFKESGLELTNVMHELCDRGKKHIPYEVRIRPTFERSKK